LGAAGIPVTTYSHEQRPPGRYSRYTNEFRRSPDPIDADAFIDWLVDEMTSGEIDLVAPTSDYVVFNTTQALERIGGGARGYAPADRVNDCLFKGRFATAIEAAGFPTPPTRMPTSFDEAIADATYLGYPLVLKPRSHVGVGVARGVVVRSEAELVRAFVPHALGEGHRSALAIDPQLRFPLLQQYRDPSRVDVISVSGALDLDGALLALGHSRKTHQWPPRLGIGTRFEAIGPQPFTEQAIAAVRTVLGHGVFELEVLVDRVTGEYWAIDLNPRGFGQMSLDIAAGRDLPVLWYNSAADIPVASARRAPGPPPKYWSMGFHYYADAYTRRWPGRASCGDVADDAGDGPNVGPMWQPRDPMPAAVWAWQVVRHPLGLVRPYFNNSELVAGHDEDPSVV
jgi:predicted ATP-grasp superfamily ATP-dependent carboligase